MTECQRVLDCIRCEVSHQLKPSETKLVLLKLCDRAQAAYVREHDRTQEEPS
mgnify:CR=1 FL=1